MANTKKNGWPETRRAWLIDDIAVASALAWTADTDAEYLYWDNQRAELEDKAGTITDEEMATITRIATAKQDAYNGEAVAREATEPDPFMKKGANQMNAAEMNASGPQPHYTLIQEGDGYIVDGVIVPVTTKEPQANGPLYTIHHFASRDEWLEGILEYTPRLSRWGNVLFDIT